MNKSEIRALQSEYRKLNSIHDDMTRLADNLKSHGSTEDLISTILNARSCMKKARMQLDDLLPDEPLITEITKRH